MQKPYGPGVKYVFYSSLAEKLQLLHITQAIQDDINGTLCNSTNYIVSSPAVLMMFSISEFM